MRNTVTIQLINKSTQETIPVVIDGYTTEEALDDFLEEPLDNFTVEVGSDIAEQYVIYDKIQLSELTAMLRNLDKFSRAFLNNVGDGSLFPTSKFSLKPIL